MLEEENQMGLFEMAGIAPHIELRQPEQTPPPPAKLSAKVTAKPASPLAAKPAPAPTAKPSLKKSKPPVAVAAPEPKKVSGLVPQGDVRLTANIRQDLHLKLKIASAHRRTTIGEIIEELIGAHL
jgi:hypothetical protein